MVALGVALAASLLLAEWGLRRDATATYYMLPTRGWELLVGALAAFALSARGAESGGLETGRLQAELMSLAGLAAVLVSIFLFDLNTPFPGVYALLPVLGTALIVLFAAPENWVGRLLGHRYMVGIGMLSYSAYLWHQPLLAFARVRSIGAPGEGLMAALALASMLLAYLSWRFVERPFRNRRNIPRRPVFILSGVGLLFFFVIGFGGRVSGGYEDIRLTERQIALRQTAQPSPQREACHTLDTPDFKPPSAACAYFGSDVSWAVLGDSHAVELAYALAQGLRPAGVGLKHLSFSGCAPVFRREDIDTACQRWTDAAVADLLDAPQIRTVVVSYRMNLYLFGEHRGVYPAHPDAVTAAERARTWKSYVAMIRRLSAAGKQVVVVLQAPELRKAVADLLLVDGDKAAIVGVQRSWWDDRQAFVRTHLAELPRGVTVVDPAELLCDAAACYAVRDGQADYFDDNHLSVHGAQRLAARILNLAGPMQAP